MELTKSDMDTIETTASKLGVIPDIHPDDLIFHFLYNHPNLSKDGAIQYYFNDGEKSARQLRSLLTDVCNYNEDIKLNLPEFASGYGCVSRHITNVLPFVDITACDIHSEARSFLEKTLGINAVLSASKPEDLVLEKNMMWYLLYRFSPTCQRKPLHAGWNGFYLL